MSVITTKIIVLEKTKERVANYTFLKVLDQDRYRSIKLPTNIEKYKLAHLLNFTNILTVDLIKTHKNWILKDILEVHTWLRPESYKDFLAVSEINKYLLGFYHDQHEVDLQAQITTYFKEQNLEGVDFSSFYLQLQKWVSIFDNIGK